MAAARTLLELNSTHSTTPTLNSTVKDRCLLGCEGDGTPTLEVMVLPHTCEQNTAAAVEGRLDNPPWGLTQNKGEV